MARSPVLDGVDARLVNLINQVGNSYGPYGVRLISGYRPPGGQGGQGYHPKGAALDVELFDKKTGQTLNNYQDPGSFAAYQQLANAIYGAADPELQKQLRWGGYFSGEKGKYGAMDLMHFDLGGAETPMAGGSWAGGLSPEQAKLWGLSGGGGVGGEQQGPAMPNNREDYSAEQRRNAIAAIESAGSGDYAALGPEIARKSGAGPGPKDRAYGRYQVMGSNVPAWTQQVLGKAMTPQEFVADPKAQDAVFDAIFGDYVKKYGESGAASMWFTGKPDAPDVKDPLGTTSRGYIDKYLNALGKPAVQGPAYPDQQPKQPDPTKPAAPTDVAKAAGEKEGFKPGDALKSLGSALTGSSGQSASVPNVQMPAPAATPIESRPGEMFNPQMVQASRDRLAQAMARLNSGKLWVG